MPPVSTCTLAIVQAGASERITPAHAVPCPATSSAGTGRTRGVPDSSVTIRDDRDRGVVEIGIPVTLDRIAAAHVDDPEAEGIIAAAVAAVLAADLGDPDAQDRVDDAEGLGLSWYASQELPILIEMI